VHRRSLEGIGPRSFQLTDRLEGGSTGVVFRWSLLVAPGLELLPTTYGWSVRRDGSALLMLAIPSQWRPSAGAEPALFSPAFGRIESTSRLVVQGYVDGTSSIQVRIDVPPCENSGPASWTG
jgi:hypothetical protein